MTETIDAVEAAMAPTTFDVLSFIESTAYPTESVKIYTAVKAADELLKANKARLDQDQNGGTEDFDARIEALTEEVKASALTFDLRGMPPGLVQETFSVKEEDSDERVQEMENLLIARTIAGVTNADGVRDPRVWSGDDVNKLRRFVKEAEFGKLTKGVINVNFNAAVFDQATDAGFLG